MMGAPRSWDDDALHLLYVEAGMTAGEVAEVVGVPYVSLIKHLRALGWTRPRGVFERAPKVDDPVLVANIAQRYVEADMTMEEIEAELGLGRHGISGVLKRAGIPIRTPAHCGGVRNQTGAKNPAWKGGPGVRPSDQRRKR